MKPASLLLLGLLLTAGSLRSAISQDGASNESPKTNGAPSIEATNQGSASAEKDAVIVRGETTPSSTNVARQDAPGQAARTNPSPEPRDVPASVNVTGLEASSTNEVVTNLRASVASNVPAPSPWLFDLGGDLVATYHQLSFGGALGYGLSGLVPGLDSPLFPESWYRVAGSLRFGISNRDGTDVGLRVRWNDPNARMNASDAFSTSKKDFVLSPSQSPGGLFSSDGKLQANLGLGLLSFRAPVGASSAVALEIGNDLSFDLGPEVMNLRAAGLKASFRSPRFDLELSGSRIGTTFDLSSGESASYRAPTSATNPFGADTTSRYFAGVDAKLRLPLGSREGDRLAFRASALRLFHTWADASAGANVVVKAVRIRIRSTASGTSTYPPLLNQKSAVVVRLKDGRSLSYADWTSAGLLASPALVVTSPVINNGTGQNGRNDKNSFQGLGDTYLQPEEVTRGAADYYKSSFTLSVPLDRSGVHSFADVGGVELQFKLRYNYVVEASLDDFNWKTLFDSASANAGYSDVGAFSTVHQNAIPNYPAGQDLDRSLTIILDPSRFSLIESKSLARLEADLKAGPFSFGASAALLAVSNLQAAEAPRWATMARLALESKDAGVRLGWRQLDLGWSTRFDGLAVHDFGSPWFALSRDQRLRSGLYGLFDAVQDLDHPSLVTRDAGLPVSDDGRQALVPGRSLPDSERNLFLFEPYRPFERLLDDRNGNGVPDAEENDIDPDYGLRAGERAATLEFGASNRNATLRGWASWRRLEREASVFQGYAYDAASARTVSVFSVAPSPAAQSLDGCLEGILDLGEGNHRVHLEAQVRGSLDAIADSLWLQRNVRETSEAQISRLDALEAFRRLRLELVGVQKLSLLPVLRVRHSLDASAALHFTGEDALTAIRASTPSSTDFFLGDSWIGAQRAVERSLALYAPGTPVRVLPAFHHELELSRRFDLAPLLFRADFAPDHPLEIGGLVSAASEMRFLPGVDENRSTDFDAAVFVEARWGTGRDAPGPETQGKSGDGISQSAVPVEKLLSRMEVRGRITQDWSAGGTLSGQALLVSGSLRYAYRATEWTFGLQWSLLDYRKDDVSTRRNPEGTRLEDLNAVQLLLSARIHI